MSIFASDDVSWEVRKSMMLLFSVISWCCLSARHLAHLSVNSLRLCTGLLSLNNLPQTSLNGAMLKENKNGCVCSFHVSTEKSHSVTFTIFSALDRL